MAIKKFNAVRTYQQSQSSFIVIFMSFTSRHAAIVSNKRQQKQSQMIILKAINDKEKIGDDCVFLNLLGASSREMSSS